uniref:Zgc:171482 n=1 Tax=Erpetoichthys calabaricus TaxID=27687 RepID=A0A8C4T7F7_ERPCA
MIFVFYCFLFLSCCSNQLLLIRLHCKKHANKVRLFYMLHPEDGGPPSKRLRPDNPDSDECEVDRNKCCTLCNMFFTSAIVAQSHYQGKTHAKRVRLVLGETPLPVTESAPCTPQPNDPAPPPTWPTGRDNEAGKFCCLCGAWFNNPLMAQQHYEGKKHKRNAARTRLLEQLAGSLGATESTGEYENASEQERPLQVTRKEYTEPRGTLDILDKSQGVFYF